MRHYWTTGLVDALHAFETAKERLVANPDPVSDKEAYEQFTEYRGALDELLVELVVERIEPDILAELRGCDAMVTRSFFRLVCDARVARVAIGPLLEEATERVCRAYDAGRPRPRYEEAWAREQWARAKAARERRAEQEMAEAAVAVPDDIPF